MTVLPYIMVSIIANLGRISMEDGKTMVINGLKILFLLLATGVVFLVLLPLALPSWSAASYFKASSIEPVPVFGVGLTIALLIATRLYLSVTLGESN